MNAPRSGQPAPDFTLPATGDRTFSLAAERGHPVVLYFYPRDNTPGCTREAEAFRDLQQEFAGAHASIAGISRDGLASHERFRARLGLDFALLADTDGVVCRLYAVIREKRMFGRTVEGIERSTFVIDGAGILRHEWRGVKVPGHAAEVLAAVHRL